MRYSYDLPTTGPYLPLGTEREESIARMLSETVRRLQEKDSLLEYRAVGQVTSLTEKYLGVRGYYYVFERPKQNKTLYWEAINQRARTANDVDLMHLAEVVLEGVPVRVSNFHMRCIYRVERADGTDYLVTLNAHDRERRVVLKSEKFMNTLPFRKWLLRYGCVWMGGKWLLCLLRHDIEQESELKTAEEAGLQDWDGRNCG